MPCFQALQLGPRPKEDCVVLAALDPWLNAGAEIGKIALGGVLAAFVTLFVTGLRQTRELERAASHLATRLVDIFERFGIGCGDIRQFHLNTQAEDPYDWSAVGRLPELPNLPEDDVGWRAIESRFAIFARTFGIRLDRAAGAIRWEAEQSDADETAFEVERQATTLGLEALGFARDIRVRYEFPAADFGWDLRGHLESELARIAAVDERRAEANRQMWENMDQERLDLIGEQPGPSA